MASKKDDIWKRKKENEWVKGNLEKIKKKAIRKSRLKQTRKKNKWKDVRTLNTKREKTKRQRKEESEEKRWGAGKKIEKIKK